ncbi:hypothetical protein AVEN_170240-1 [Araneus ventricosus]|uniref:Uncharacterized protein n=1 Tax=Araneus ventricosus TaxID=182803 RepID=A0A4Y2TX60_ARAVE|nr:hypothetical protein AVEN_170240-1 [Araneus ventricosus]
MTKTTPELAPPLQTSAPYQWEDVCSPKYDLTCNRPYTRRIFNGISFRTWSLPAPRPDLVTRPLRPQFSLRRYKKRGEAAKRFRTVIYGDLSVFQLSIVRMPFER